MADPPSSLAQAAARIAELEDELRETASTAAQMRTERDVARQNLQAAQEHSGSAIALQAQLDELRAQLAPPPSGSGITLVQRYRTAHDTLHVLLGDALHANRMHVLTSELNMTKPQAEAAIMKGDQIVKALTAKS